MIKESIQYSLRPTPLIRYLFYGTVLALSQMIVIGLPLLIGYVIRTLRESIENDTERPPSFQELGILAYDGIIGTAILICYVVVPALAVLVLQNAPLDLILESRFVPTLVLLLQLLTIIVSIMLTFLFPAALLTFVKTDSVQSVFQFENLRTQLSISYVWGWISFLIVSTLLGILINGFANLLLTIPLGFTLNFITYVCFGYIFSRQTADTEN